MWLQARPVGQGVSLVAAVENRRGEPCDMPMVANHVLRAHSRAGDPTFLITPLWMVGSPPRTFPTVQGQEWRSQMAMLIQKLGLGFKKC